MSEVKESNSETQIIEFDPILPDTGVLFYEECPAEFEIERPRLLPLKSSTQLRFEQLQHEAARVWREKQKSPKTAKNQLQPLVSYLQVNKTQDGLHTLCCGDHIGVCAGGYIAVQIWGLLQESHTGDRFSTDSMVLLVCYYVRLAIGYNICE